MAAAEAQRRAEREAAEARARVEREQAEARRAAEEAEAADRQRRLEALAAADAQRVARLGQVPGVPVLELRFPSLPNSFTVQTQTDSRVASLGISGVPPTVRATVWYNGQLWAEMKASWPLSAFRWIAPFNDVGVFDGHDPAAKFLRFTFSRAIPTFKAMVMGCINGRPITQLWDREQFSDVYVSDATALAIESLLAALREMDEACYQSWLRHLDAFGVSAGAPAFRYQLDPHDLPPRPESVIMLGSLWSDPARDREQNIYFDPSSAVFTFVTKTGPRSGAFSWGTYTLAAPAWQLQWRAINMRPDYGDVVIGFTQPQFYRENNSQTASISMMLAETAKPEWRRWINYMASINGPAYRQLIQQWQQQKSMS
jgi:hypothetical protein